MLTLARYTGETIVLSNGTKVVAVILVRSVGSRRVELSINAPDLVAERGELHDRREAERTERKQKRR